MVDVMAPGARVWESHAASSIADPGADPHVLTVGAVDSNGYLSNDLERFSSQGPVASGVQKPEMSGPDGVSVQAYGARGFYGTSAATPVVAAMVAVVMSEDPTLSPKQAADRLRGWAWGSNGVGQARLPVRGETSLGCGTGPSLLPLLFLPLGWVRRARRSTASRRQTSSRQEGIG
jgi:subtilisin family serine protease